MLFYDIIIVEKRGLTMEKEKRDLVKKIVNKETTNKNQDKNNKKTGKKVKETVKDAVDWVATPGMPEAVMEIIESIF